MKKLFLIAAILIPLCMTGQNRHRFDVGTGFVVPKEFLTDEELFPESNTVNLYGGYRYELPSGLSFGLQYSFVPNHKGSRDIVIPPSDEEESVETVQTLVMTSRYHTINAIVDYKVGTFGPLSIFIGGGAGAQCRHASYSHSLYDGYFWSTDICLYAGLELFDHLRLTLGHNHDLHAQISALPTGAPFYYINIGWAF